LKKTKNAEKQGNPTVPPRDKRGRISKLWGARSREKKNVRREKNGGHVKRGGGKNFPLLVVFRRSEEKEERKYKKGQNHSRERAREKNQLVSKRKRRGQGPNPLVSELKGEKENVKKRGEKGPGCLGKNENKWG